MNNRRKKKLIKKRIRGIFILLLIIIIIIGSIKIFTKDNNSDNLVYNKNKSFLKKQKVQGIVFKDIKCTYDGKDSLISYVIVNKTKKKVNLNNYEIIVKDKNKKMMTKIVFSYNNDLLPNKEVEISNSVRGIDLSDARYMDLKLNSKKHNKTK